jgi:D-lactate dehydrogenase (cytochrome)
LRFFVSAIRCTTFLSIYFVSRLHARPETHSAAVVSFSNIQEAIDTVVGVLQASVPVARIEFLDQLSIKICNAHSKTDYEEAPTLFLEFHGSPVQVEAEMELVSSIASANGGSEFNHATTEEQRNKLWQCRHDLHWALRTYKPGFDTFGTDICVPISNLPATVNFSNELFGSLGIQGKFYKMYKYD